MIDFPQARYIVETLQKAGFTAYYAGGWVRDLLLQHPSDDIDIATNAPPETIQALFPRTVPIGLAFGIILVIHDGHEYEVATFRQDMGYTDGRRPTQVTFTTAVEDAKRRDFTINGMFYDPVTEELFDFIDGQKDLEKKIIRAIGNPHERIKEDRLRMIRAIRMACRFDFFIELETERAIVDHAKELFPAVAMERVWQEFVKAHHFGKLRPMLTKLHLVGLLQTIFPELKDTSYEEIKHRLEPIQYYPIKAPAIAFILPLFLNQTLDDALQLCKYLKLSNQDLQFVRFLFHAKGLLQLIEPPALYEWAYLYANQFAAFTLQILAAHLEHREAFLHEHEKQMATLQTSIAHIQKNDPVVKSEHLLKMGIKAGPAMGKLLKEAERISINEQLHTADAVLKRLKESTCWPH